MLRGLALLIIFIDHIPGIIFSGMTPQAFGYADAAEAFVLIAGISAYHAYNARMGEVGFVRGSLPILNRVWQLYVTHLALVVLVAGIAAYAARRFADPNYLEAMGFDIFLADPALAIVGVVTLTFLPNYLDILPLYMVALGLLPLVLLALRVNVAIPLALSFGLYVAAQATGVNLPNIQASRVWFFNPFAWQFLFVAGVALAHLGASGALDRFFARKRLVQAVTLLAAAYVLLSLVSVAPWRQIPDLANFRLIDPNDLPVADKTNLSPLRLVDAFAKAWLIAALVPRAAGCLSRWPFALLAIAGRQSLPVFVLGLVLSTVAGIVIKEGGYAVSLQAAVVLVGSGLMLAFAAMLDWQARMSRQDGASRAARPLRGAALSLPRSMVEPPTQ
jgi:hypothetical protein